MSTRYRELLTTLLAYKSISTDAEFADQITATAEHLKNVFAEQGFTAQIVQGYGNPLVVARFTVDPALETCLVYGHYDVQPAKFEDGWNSEPFELHEQGGRLFGRGVVDNKGQFLMHVATVFDLIAEKKLRYNVVFLIEGDEETGSGDVGKFLRENKDLLKADFALISDGEYAPGEPTVEIGFRGTGNAELHIKTGETDLHSGLFGGTVPNAALELSRIIASLTDEQNKVLVPGYYDGAEITDAGRAHTEALPFSEKQYMELAGVQTLFAESGENMYAQLGLRPCLEVSGIATGYSGVGFRNSVPAEAMAKINLRFGPDQNPDRVIESLRMYIASIVPEYVTWEFTPVQASKGVLMATEEPAVQRAVDVLAHVHGKTVLYKYCGATIPIVTDFKDVLGLVPVTIPLCNDDCRMHAANENLSLDYLEKGLAFSREFLGR